MTHKNVVALIMGLGLVMSSGAAFAGGSKADNPIFGGASVQKLSMAENKAVVGKGADADYYGYYGTYYASLASNYGAQGYYYKNYSYYNSASSYAYQAYQDYSYASYYQQHGM